MCFSWAQNAQIVLDIPILMKEDAFLSVQPVLTLQLRKLVSFVEMDTSGMEKHAKNCAPRVNTSTLLQMNANAPLVYIGLAKFVSPVIVANNSKMIPKLVSALQEQDGMDMDVPRQTLVPMERNGMSLLLPVNVLLAQPGMELSASSLITAEEGNI